MRVRQEHVLDTFLTFLRRQQTQGAGIDRHPVVDNKRRKKLISGRRTNCGGYILDFHSRYSFVRCQVLRGLLQCDQLVELIVQGLQTDAQLLRRLGFISLMPL